MGRHGSAVICRITLFALAFDAVAEELDRHLRLPLRNVLWEGDEALLTSTEFAQPALFAIEVALATLLQHWGISPDFLIGHSVGEIAAAHLAGVLSLTDAAGLVAARGRLMAELPAGGVMVVVAASEEEVLPVLVDGANLAAVNAPHSVVVSGCEAAVSDIADHFARRGRRSASASGITCVSFVADGTDACRVHADRCRYFGVETADSVGVQCDRADGRRRLRRWTVLGGACAAPRAICRGRPVAECGWGHKVC